MKSQNDFPAMKGGKDLENVYLGVCYQVFARTLKRNDNETIVTYESCSEAAKILHSLA